MLDMNTVRSLLFVPADKEKMLDKSLVSSADVAIYDLEDSVVPENKAHARQLVCDYLPKAAAAGKRVVVRINSLENPNAREDIAALVAAGVETVMLPKADKGQVLAACELLSEAESKQSPRREQQTRLIPLVESPSGIVNVHTLLSESTRVVAALLGAEDLTKELGIPRTKQGREIEYSRAHFAMACCAKGIVAIDTPYTDIKDIDGLQADTLLAQSLAFTAKACIHPSHIESINQVFSPSAQEMDFAHRVLAEAETDENKTKGAFSFEGRMIDAPILERARRTLGKAQALGLIGAV